MKIRIDANGRHFTIPIPLGLIINKASALIAAKCLERYTKGQLNAKQINFFFHELKLARRRLGHLMLVDVKSSSGEKVQITL